MIWVSIAAGVSFSWVASDPDLGSRELHSYRRWRGGATADPFCASAPRAMHKTPRHARLEHRQAAGAVLPPRESDRATARARSMLTVLLCAGPAALQDWTARAYAGRPTSGGGPPARQPAIFSLPSMCQCRAIRHGRQK